MSEKPQETRGNKQEDLLEQIITQGLNQTKASAQVKEEAPTDETPPAPKQEKVDEAVPPAEKKHRRHTVYLYLLILFGAAFLMLLLAYFVQQRSNEYAMERFRSIDELLEDNRTLREKNEALEAELARLNGDLSQLQERYEEKEGEAANLSNTIYHTQEELSAWVTFWELERFYQAEDYESCAAILLMEGFRYQVPESAQTRHDEIVQAVISQGLLSEDYMVHVSDYQDLINAYLERQPNLIVSRETRRRASFPHKA